MLPIYKPHRLLLVLCVPVVLSCASTSSETNSINLEQSLCGPQEAIAFWLWNYTAGKPDTSRMVSIRNLEKLTFTTKDNRILRGYKLKAYSPDGKSTAAKGYLLVAQGNAMLAEHIINSFQRFTSAGYDVYIFDYRGYGRSEGKRRLKAILSDYGEIIGHLDSLPYANQLFYGMSFGGIILMDALHGRPGRSRMVIDSTPSRLSDYGCPEAHDPIMNLPEDCSNLLIIVGDKDTVVKPAMTKELFDLAGMRGATLLQAPDLAHPFMDREASSHQHRMNAVKSFLLGERY